MSFRRYPVDPGLVSMFCGHAPRSCRTNQVILPYTEAAAGANTFVCEFTGGAAANETGVGLGLAGADLVFTQVGSVGASSSGYRPIAGASQYFTCTVPFLQAFLNGSEYTLMRKIKNVATTTGKYISYLEGTTTAQFDINPTGKFRDVHYQSSGSYPSLSPSTTFANNVEYWHARWKKNGVLHFGWVAASAGVPTGWDSFPPGQRAAVYGIPDFTGEAWGTTRAIVGLSGSSAIHEIGVLVASKYGLGAAPV